jgi:hypothetical protein
MLMCLEIYSEMNIKRSIKCLSVYDEGKFISMELGNYYKEVGMERACSVVTSYSNSSGQRRMCYLVTRLPLVAEEWKILEEVWTCYMVITQM